MRPLPLAVVLSATLGLWASTANACSCVFESNDRAGAERTFERADAVFVGRALRTESGAWARVTFEILKPLKGPTGTTVEVGTPGLSECGIDFAPNEPYVVFAHWSSDYPTALTTSVCSGTNPVQSMKGYRAEWLAFLDELPDLRKQNEPGRGGCASCASTGPGLSMAALLTTGRVLRRRRKAATSAHT